MTCPVSTWRLWFKPESWLFSAQCCEVMWACWTHNLYPCRVGQPRGKLIVQMWQRGKSDLLEHVWFLQAPDKRDRLPLAHNSRQWSHPHYFNSKADPSEIRNAGRSLSAHRLGIKLCAVLGTRGQQGMLLKRIMDTIKANRWARADTSFEHMFQAHAEVQMAKIA